MKLSLACALVAATVAQLAGASVAVEQHNAAVERSFAPRVVDGHLHMLSSSKHRRHHARGSNKKRATGYCKPKSSAASAGSGSTSSNTVSASSSSSSSSSSAQAPSSTAGSSGGNSNSGSSSGSNSGSSSSSDDDDDTSPITSGSGTSASSLGSISQFQGTNSGIGSWFKTNAGSDHTNGQSWCQTWYQDSWMGFAPSVGLMLSNFGGDYNAAAKAYCGREVKFTNPNNGKTAIGFIADGFDDTWAKRSGNTDLTVALFTALYGSFDNNKNTVIRDLQWELTGNVVQQGTFQNNKYSQ